MENTEVEKYFGARISSYHVWITDRDKHKAMCNAAREWASENAKHDWEIMVNRIWFVDKADAALFKLFWIVDEDC